MLRDEGKRRKYIRSRPPLNRKADVLVAEGLEIDVTVKAVVDDPRGIRRA